MSKPQEHKNKPPEHKPPEPEAVVIYRARKKEPVPRCCHTCDNYNEAGWCAMFDLKPPNEFTHEFNKCPEWIEEVPF